MNIVWDERKRRASLKKHGLDFHDAAKAFDGITYTIEDKRFDYGERRFITIAMLNDIIVVLAHIETERELRLLSMRKATRHEQIIFFENI